MSIENQKPMWFEEFAVAIQKDLLGLRDDMSSIREDMNKGFADIHVVMATKQDLADLRDEMISRFATHSELQVGLDRVKDELLEEIGKIKYAKETDELRSRMNHVENQLGVNHGVVPA